MDVYIVRFSAHENQWKEALSTVTHWCWEKRKQEESVILSDRSSDLPGAEPWVSKPPPGGGLNQIVYVLILSQCSLLSRPDTGEDMTPPPHCLRNNKIVFGLFVSDHIILNHWICRVVLTIATCARTTLSSVCSISFVHRACAAGFSAQTDESLRIPFIKGDIRCLTVLGLEVKYKEHKHGDHTAGCRPASWLLKVLFHPASHTQTKTLRLLCQLTTWDVSLCWQRKRHPLLDQRGLGISASTPTAAHHSSLSAASCSSSSPPNPHL